MANNPKKIKDPTDTALTAIQEVLSTTDQPSTGRSDMAGDPMAGEFSDAQLLKRFGDVPDDLSGLQ